MPQRCFCPTFRGKRFIVALHTTWRAPTSSLRKDSSNLIFAKLSSDTQASTCCQLWVTPPPTHELQTWPLGKFCKNKQTNKQKKKKTPLKNLSNIFNYLQCACRICTGKIEESGPEFWAPFFLFSLLFSQYLPPDLQSPLLAIWWDWRQLWV